jgi:hypothetical protein
MPISIDSRSADGILTVKVDGRLTAPEWHAAQAAALAHMAAAPAGNVSVLVIAENFLGWSRGAWPDSPHQRDFDEHVHRLAIVAEPQWEDLALLFAGKGLRRIPIEYFPPTGLEAARRWLNLPMPRPG